MSDRRLITLIDHLRSQPTETEWLEFKRNHLDPQSIGEYMSGLANSACIASKQRGYLIFGIDDSSHDVVGTHFDPYTEKAKGNQDLLLWLTSGLNPRVGLEARAVDHPDGRVVLFEVGAASGQPVEFYGSAFIRIGTSLTSLSRHPEKARLIWTRHLDWSGEVCPAASIADLDPEALSEARRQYAEKHPNRSAELTGWDDVTFLNKARVLRQGAITNAAIVLLGRPESASLLSPAVARISWILKDGDNRELDYEHFDPPFLLAGDRLLGRLRNLTLRTLPSGTLFPREISQYDPWVIREALHNSIAHQDYGLHERIIVVEYPDRVLLSNVGSFLPGDVETVIRQDAPQAIYRNTCLATAMVELNLIDTQGGGIKRMFETQHRRSFPLPDYDLSVSEHVSVSLSGRILDERFTRLLMERTDLNLEKVILLDRVQKKRIISRDENRVLRAAGLVEGRYPNLIIAAAVARATGEPGRHIRERGFENQYYLDMILALVQRHGPVSRQDIDDTLLPKLPDSLNADQKKSKVHNLLRKLSREGLISNTGTRHESSWTTGTDQSRPKRTDLKSKETKGSHSAS